MTAAQDWQSRVGEVWAAEWRRTDRSFAALSPALDAAILAAAPAGPFRALDIGCGAGATAAALARARPDATVVGVDLSPALVAAAAARWPDDRLHFVVGDAGVVAGEVAPVDLFVSRHGVMFFADPVTAFAQLARAAAPGARLVFSCFAERRANCFAADLLAILGEDAEAPACIGPGPFAFADPAHVGAILERAGWSGSAERIDFAYRAGAGDDPVGDATDLLCRIGPAAAALRRAPAERRADLVAQVREACRARARDGVVDFPAAAWIWSAIRRGEPRP